MLSLGKKTGWADDSYRPSGTTIEMAGSATPRGICGNLDCTGSWTAPWRSRRRPIFEGHWGCSGRCILAMVRASVRRESGEGQLAPRPLHRHRVPLGLVLLAQGWISHSQLQTALDAQRERGGRIGERLVEDCGLDVEQITRGLSMQWSCPVLGVSGFSPREMALVAPKVFVQKFGILPLRVAGSRILYIGFEDSLDASVALALEQMSELKVESGLVRTEEYIETRRRVLEYDGVPLVMETMPEADSLAARIAAILEQKQPVASKLVRLHQYHWLRLWLEGGTKGAAGTLPRSTEDMLDYVFTIGGAA